MSRCLANDCSSFLQFFHFNPVRCISRAVSRICGANAIQGLRPAIIGERLFFGCLSCVFESCRRREKGKRDTNQRWLLQRKWSENERNATFPLILCSLLCSVSRVTETGSLSRLPSNCIFFLLHCYSFCFSPFLCFASAPYTTHQIKYARPTFLLFAHRLHSSTAGLLHMLSLAILPSHPPYALGLKSLKLLVQKAEIIFSKWILYWLCFLHNFAAMYTLNSISIAVDLVCF